MTTDSLQPAKDGHGPLLQRDYWAVLDPPVGSASELMDTFVEQFEIFAPPDLMSFSRCPAAGARLEPGDELEGADKTRLLPSRSDPLPWAARTLLGGAAAWLMAPGPRSSRAAAAVVGSLSAAATTWLVTSARSAARAHDVSDLIPALGEDLVVVRLVRSFQPPYEETV